LWTQPHRWIFWGLLRWPWRVQCGSGVLQLSDSNTSRILCGAGVVWCVVFATTSALCGRIQPNIIGGRDQKRQFRRSNRTQGSKTAVLSFQLDRNRRKLVVSAATVLLIRIRLHVQSVAIAKASFGPPAQLVPKKLSHLVEDEYFIKCLII